MSEQDRNTSAGQSSEGSGNQSGNRNRSRNRNRNRNRRSSGQSGGGNRQGGGQRNNQRRQHNNAESPRRRAPKPKPLTTWEKIKKFFGLYKPEAPQAAATKSARKAARPRKENVRDASGRNQSGDRREGGNRRNDNRRDDDRQSGDGRSDDDDRQGGGGGRNGAGKTARARQKPRPTPDSSSVEGKRLYVGNLSYDAAEHDLEDLFKGVGAVRNVEIVYNRNTHRSKGYGFVEMARTEESKRAVEVLHDQPFMGRTLIVNGAKSSGPIDSDGDPAPQENPPPNLPENTE